NRCTTVAEKSAGSNEAARPISLRRARISTYATTANAISRAIVQRDILDTLRSAKCGRRVSSRIPLRVDEGTSRDPVKKRLWPSLRVALEAVEDVLDPGQVRQAHVGRGQDGGLVHDGARLGIEHLPARGDQAESVVDRRVPEPEGGVAVEE